MPSANHSISCFGRGSVANQDLNYYGRAGDIQLAVLLKLKSMAQFSVLRYRNLIVTTSVTDQMLARAYFQMQSDGTLPVVYYDEVPTLLEFMNGHLGQGCGRIVLGCFRENGTLTPDFCGFGWSMNSMVVGDKRKSDCGFCFFKGQKGSDSVDFGRMMLDVFFRSFDIDILFGMTPEDNKLATRFIQKVGISVHGPVPDFATWQGKPTGAWISHIRKESFLERGYLDGAEFAMVEEGKVWAAEK